jgi:hypothetical protein
MRRFCSGRASRVVSAAAATQFGRSQTSKPATSATGTWQQQGWGMLDPQDKEAHQQASSIRDGYDRAQENAVYRLSQPIPKPVADDLAPDFLVGVVDYKYTNRSQWRVVLARVIGIEDPLAIRLSIAWHGRLPHGFMSGLQKAIGVTIDATKLPANSPFATMTDSQRKSAIASVIERINNRDVIDLVELSIVKALDGAAVSRTERGQPIMTPADVVRLACGERKAVCFCEQADLEWALEHVVQRAVSARVDVRVVVVDETDSKEAGELTASLQSLVDEHARQNRPLPDKDGHGILVHEGDIVPLSRLYKLPLLCVNGVVSASGKGLVDAVVRQRQKFGKLVYAPDDITFSSLRNR